MSEWSKRNPDGSLTVGILEDVAIMTAVETVEKPVETVEKPKKKTTKKK